MTQDVRKSVRRLFDLIMALTWRPYLESWVGIETNNSTLYGFHPSASFNFLSWKIISVQATTLEEKDFDKSWNASSFLLLDLSTSSMFDESRASIAINQFQRATEHRISIMWTSFRRKFVWFCYSWKWRETSCRRESIIKQPNKRAYISMYTVFVNHLESIMEEKRIVTKK